MLEPEGVWERTVTATDWAVRILYLALHGGSVNIDEDENNY